MTAHACIGEPISWLRLEIFAAGRDTSSSRAEVAHHLDACEACRRCLGEINGDLVALPALPAAPPRRGRWPSWRMPALGIAVAVAAVLVLVLWRGGDDLEPRGDRVAIKGVGDVVIGVVRERDGAITHDATTFLPGDRWKLVVTCPPTARARFAVEIHELGGGATIDHPVAAAELACGNRVVIPGAFALDGPHAHRVCVDITAAAGHAGRACVTLARE